MNYIDHFFSHEVYGEPVNEEQAVLEACRLIDEMGAWMAAHESEIDYDAPTPFDEEEAMEGAGYDETHKYPIFIILTKGHTILSKIIFKATGDEHSHASISFGIGLNKIYSFGTKKLNPKREMGFVMTSYDSSIWGDIPTEYDLYVTFVDGPSRHKMYQKLQYFTSNADKLKYHWAGLVKIFFNIKATTNQQYICSRFVAAILNTGGVKLERDESLYRPSQLRDVYNVEHVISGPSIQKYNEELARIALEKVKNK